MKVSLCVSTLTEEENLERCLESPGSHGNLGLRGRIGFPTLTDPGALDDPFI